MTLTDAGPLVALFDRRDPLHDRCLEAARSLPPTSLLTTWPCISEATHLLRRSVGWPGVEQLWNAIEFRRIEIAASQEEDIDRIYELMRQYRDLPMDLADASLVALAERLNVRLMFTIDSDFRIYQLRSGSYFTVIP